MTFFQILIYICTLCCLAFGYSLDSFSFTATLHIVDWDERCLSEYGCYQPWLNLIRKSSETDVKMSFSRPAPLEYTMNRSRSFSMDWVEPTPADHLTISCEVTDRLSRLKNDVCDSSEEIHVFDRKHMQKLRTARSATPHFLPAVRNATANLRGRCFNATVTLIEFAKRCSSCVLDKKQKIFVDEFIRRQKTTIQTAVAKQIEQDKPPLDGTLDPLDSKYRTIVILLLAIVLLVAIVLPAAFIICSLCRLRHSKNVTRPLTVRSRNRGYAQPLVEDPDN